MNSAPSTPCRPTRFVSYSPTSPLAFQRQSFSTVSSSQLPPLPISPYKFNAAGVVVENIPSEALSDFRVEINTTTSFVEPVESVQPFADLSLRSMAVIEANSHAIRQTLVAQEQSDKQTKNNYARHVLNYEAWWAKSQYDEQAKDPSWTVIPSMPITVAKTMLFLDHEMKRPQKRKRGDGAPSTSICGIEHIKQVISALQHRRLNDQHLYPNIPEAHVILRTDPRIKTAQSAAAHNEPERIKKAHILKAKGTLADSYTDTELVRCSMSFLGVSGPAKIWVAMRDRAMLLTSSTTAFRGDSTRSLLWSDMYKYDIPIHSKGRGEKVPALPLIADNSKHNQNGRIDEHGAFRHFHAELCPVGALALFFFVHFHVTKALVPDFAPDFSDVNYGEYGRRDWYALHTFSSSKDCTSEMSYGNHRSRVQDAYAKNNITITKKTHAGREFTTKTAREYGASSEAVKALGGWSESGSYRACYDRALPVKALLGAAMFDADHPESHFLARDALVPPTEIFSQLFPWIEDEQMKLLDREKQGRHAQDIALRQFLNLMMWFRIVVVQDAAVLYPKYLECPIWNFPPFNCILFRNFAAQSATRIAEVEDTVRLALERLPEHVASTFKGALSKLSVDQKREQDANRAYQQSVMEEMGLIKGLIEDRAGPSKRRKTGQAARPPISPPPMPISVPRAAMYPPSNASAGTLLPLTFPSTPSLGAPAEPPRYLADISEGLSDEWTAPSDFCSTVAGTSAFPEPMVPLPQRATSVPSPTTQSTSSTVSFVATTEAQLDAWRAVESRLSQYRETCLRRQNWEWIPDLKVWLPYYTYQDPKKITDYWAEWTDGLNGYLPVCVLEEVWGPKWRRNNKGMQTERCRRRKVIDLIENLSRKPNWTVELTLRFLRDRYELPSPRPFPTPRGFTEYLQKKGGIGATEVMKASESYP